MFSQFIYLIVVLLIYTTYQPPTISASETPAVSFWAGLSILFLLSTLFHYVARFRFRQVEKDLTRGSAFPVNLEFGHRHFDQMMRRFTFIAIGLFTFTVYGLDLPFYFLSLPFLRDFPTLSAVLFMLLFMGLMSIVWNAAYPVYRTLNRMNISKRAYILSNITFSLPMLLPWLIISVFMDMVHLLPFEGLKRLLVSPEGEALFFVVFLVFVAMIGPAMIQRFWRCRPLPDGIWRDRIEHLCRRAGLKYAEILYWPIFGGRMITAGVMGLVQRFRYLLVTEALLSQLTPEEIDTVIAHEIGHVKKRHLWFYLLFFGGYLLLYYAVFELVILSILYAKPVLFMVKTTGISPDAMAAILVTLTMVVLFLLYFRYIFGYFMRNFERQADTYVFTLFDDAKPLISTFNKIVAASGQPPNRPNWHHFSIAQRVEYLEKCQSDRTYISRHDQKVTRGILFFTVGLLVTGFVGYQLNFGDAGTRLNRRFLEKIIMAETDMSPDKPELYRALGDLYYDQEDDPKARDAYEKALTLSPNDPNVLNNLAWLLATSGDESIQNPSRALTLARKAAAILPEPHVLDTLAESCWINRRFEEAVVIGARALSLAKENRPYFKDQLKKFRKAFEIQGNAEQVQI